MATVLAIRGPLLGARLPVEGEIVSIGRAGTCTIALSDGTVSREHAVFRRQRHGWQLEDLGSSAGTYHNGKPVGEPVLLKPEDEIRIGHSIFLFDSSFDLQNADFTEHCVYFSLPREVQRVDPTIRLERASAAGRDQSSQIDQFLTLIDCWQLPHGEALRHLVRKAGKLLKSEALILLTKDESTGQLRAAAAEAAADLLVNCRLVYTAHESGETIGPDTVPPLQPHPAQEAPQPVEGRHTIAAPLMSSRGSLGVLYARWSPDVSLTRADLHLTMSLASMFTNFLEFASRLNQKGDCPCSELEIPYVRCESTVMARTIEIAERAAHTAAPILLTGEMGTGKSALARAIHRSSESNGARPFIVTDCATLRGQKMSGSLFGREFADESGTQRLQQGLVERANGGTLVLDNIELLELPAQAQLLRLINERVFQRAGSSRALRVSARIIATTRVDLEPLARKGSFLPDLLQRLQTVLLPMAPLRSRPEDIRPLTDAAVRTYARCRKRDVIGVSGEALQQLEEHSWPGNVWELLTCVERAVLVSDDAILLPRHFLLSAAAATPSHSAVVAREEPNDTFVLRKLQDVEREYVLKVLKEAHNNHLRAAQLLGIPPSELEARLQSYGVIM